MKKAIAFVSLLIGALFVSSGAFAQTTATYDWVIKNGSSVTIEEDGVPTTTGYQYPYMPSGINPGQIANRLVNGENQLYDDKILCGRVACIALLYGVFVSVGS